MKKLIFLLFLFSTFIAACSKSDGDDNKEVSVTSVQLSLASATITMEGSQQLSVTLSPANATNTRVTWSSSNTAVATVSSTGLVTAISEGTATITATAGGVSARCTVTVKKKEVAVISIELNKASLELEVGASEALSATVSPTEATDKTVVWSTSSTTVVTVNGSGVVTAMGVGTANITASAGGKSATCTVTVKPATVEVTSVALSSTELTLSIGDNHTLIAMVSPENATNKMVNWNSSNTVVATVDESGVVSAVDGGTATITASAGGKSATCEVTVRVPVASVMLDKTTLVLNKGDNETLMAIVSPSNATDKTVTWGSFDTEVATVSSSGLVTAVGGGTTTIIAVAGDKSSTCKVTVRVPVASVMLDKTTLVLNKGDNETLTATVSPSNATDKTVTWGSSDISVARVNISGVVTAVNRGVAAITATAGGKSTTCYVIVNVPVTSIALNKTSITIDKGNSETLTATVSPSNATNKTVTWSSSNTSVATVSSSGTVTAAGGGTAIITATAGGKSAACTITVNVPVTSVTLNKTSLVINKGNSETLVATVSPADATDKTVTWRSSNTSVATVSSSGVVSAIDSGTAIITATAGNESATCTVTIRNAGSIGDRGEDNF